jgi:hypothetical protein
LKPLPKSTQKEPHETIKDAIDNPDPAVRIAVTRFATNLVSNNKRSQSLIRALQSAEILGGLSQAFDEIEEYHPKSRKLSLKDY